MIMSKIIILAVIAVSANAQFGDEVRETFRVNTDELRVNQGNPGETLRLNPRHRHRNTEIVGGFQNGNFAHHDGRLKTNLDSSRIVTDNQNFQPRLESQYVEEGAAFSRPEGQFNVHSSQGRADHITSEDSNDENRRQTQNLGRQNGERSERPNNQRNQNINEQTDDRQSYVQNNDRQSNVQTYDRQGNNDQSESRNVNNDQNRYNQNTPDINNQRDYNSDRVNIDQNIRDQNIDYNAQNSRSNNNQNRNYDQSTQTANDGQSNSRQNGQNIRNNAQNNNQNRFNNQNTQTTNQNRNQNERNQNSGTSFDETVSKIDSISRTIAENVSKNRQNYDREDMDREINKQITKMIFDDSVQPERTTKKTTKTTQDNELPSRSHSGKDDKWIWSDGSETTKAPTTPAVDDRAAFVGDQCPTGQVKFNKVCVDVDP